MRLMMSKKIPIKNNQSSIVNNHKSNRLNYSNLTLNMITETSIRNHHPFTITICLMAEHWDQARVLHSHAAHTIKAIARARFRKKMCHLLGAYCLNARKKAIKLAIERKQNAINKRSSKVCFSFSQSLRCQPPTFKANIRWAQSKR